MTAKRTFGSETSPQPFTFAGMDADSAFFKARTAERIGRLQDSVEFMSQLLTSGQKPQPGWRSFYVELFSAIFERYSKDIRLISEHLTDSIVADNVSFGRVIQNLLARVQNEVASTHVRFLQLATMYLLAGDTHLREKIQLHKLIGDSFRFVADSSGRDSRENARNQARDSYEAALRLSKQEYGQNSEQYLGLLVNWTAFQYKYLGQREQAVELLFATYSRMMSSLGENPPGHFAEITY
jgi:14-3-3 protein beta/theta/zeta